MGFELSRKHWEAALERISRLESKIHAIDIKLELIEKKLKPAELYRVVKQQEHEESVVQQSLGIQHFPQ